MSGVADICAGRGHRAFREFRRGVQADIRRYQNKSPENAAKGDTFRTRLGALVTPQLMCLVLYRLAHFLHARDWRRLSLMLSGVNQVLFKVNISPGSCIGPGCFLPHPAGVTFHGVAGSHVTLFAQCVCCPSEARLGAGVETGPWLGDRVTVGCTAVVEGRVRVGDGVNVAPLTRLDRDAPAGVIAITAWFRAHLTPAERGGMGAGSPSSAADHGPDRAEEHAQVEPE